MLMVGIIFCNEWYSDCNEYFVMNGKQLYNCYMKYLFEWFW